MPRKGKTLEFSKQELVTIIDALSGQSSMLVDNFADMGWCASITATHNEDNAYAALELAKTSQILNKILKAYPKLEGGTPLETK